MISRLSSLVFTVTIFLIFFSVNISYADNIKFTGKIETTTGQEYKGKITAFSNSGKTESLKVVYQGNLTFIQIDQIKTIEILDSEKKELTIEFKTGKKYIVNSIERMSPLFNLYIDLEIGKTYIDIKKIKKITFHEILK